LAVSAGPTLGRPRTITLTCSFRDGRVEALERVGLDVREAHEILVSGAVLD
jgi:hypothetical protein